MVVRLDSLAVKWQPALGPLTIYMYGLMLLLGIFAAVGLTGYRWTRRGGWGLVFRAAVWGVAFGVVGARVYHDVMSWNEVPKTWWGPFAVWQGRLVFGDVTYVGRNVACRSWSVVRPR